MNNKKYNIPEKITNLIFDFDKFISYIEEEKIVLTSKNHYLKRKDLHEINKIMSEPQKDVTKNNDQPRYVRLNLFYYLGLAGNLFRKRGSEEGKQVRLIINENIYNEFKNLNLVEKYFSLLKIFWVDTDWKKLQTGYYNDSPINTVSDVINIVANKANSKIKIPSGSRLIQLLYNWNAFLKYFEFFGLWEVVEGETEFKNSYKAEAIKTTDLGNKILNILNTDRSIMEWNKHVSENDRKNDFTDMILNRYLSQFDEDKNKNQDRVNKNDNNYENREEFFLPFVDLFFEYQVGKILSEKEIDFFTGNIVFKVELTKKMWVKVKLNGKHTLDDLHSIIQKAFKFDYYHLYAFFMDGKPWSDNCYNSPNDNRKPFADNVKIGELDLYKGKNFLYIYDFGDDWRFQVKVVDLENDKKELSKPTIIDKSDSFSK